MTGINSSLLLSYPLFASSPFFSLITSSLILSSLLSPFSNLLESPLKRQDGAAHCAWRRRRKKRKRSSTRPPGRDRQYLCPCSCSCLSAQHSNTKHISCYRTQRVLIFFSHLRHRAWLSNSITKHHCGVLKNH